MKQSADRIELTIRRDEPRSLAEGKGGEQARNELMGISAERNAAASIVEQTPPVIPNTFGLPGRCVPLLIQQRRCVQPGLLLCLESGIRPGLV
jgi:hypothetical protein